MADAAMAPFADGGVYVNLIGAGEQEREEVES
jgi:hypothetical protein